MTQKTSIDQFMLNKRLLLAAQNGKMKKIRFLLEKGADVNARDAHTNTPLLVATRHNHLGAARLFIEWGADVRINNDWAMVNAIHNESIPLIQLLLDAGADLKNPRQDILYGAVRSKNMELLRFLLVNGIAIKNYGKNAIDAALQLDLMDAVQLLIHFKLPLNIAIAEAKKYTRPHILEWLQNMDHAQKEQKILEQVRVTPLQNKGSHRI